VGKTFQACEVLFKYIESKAEKEVLFMKIDLNEKAKKQIGIETIAEIIKEIQGLTGNQRNNVCDECHRKECNTEYSIYLYDTGICDSCEKMGDLVNVSIANYVKDKGINEILYWESGLPRIFRQGKD